MNAQLAFQGPGNLVPDSWLLLWRSDDTISQMHPDTKPCVELGTLRSSTNSKACLCVTLSHLTLHVQYVWNSGMPEQLLLLSF